MTKKDTFTLSFKQTPIGRIPKEWDVVKLGTYIDVYSGYAFKRQDFQSDKSKEISIIKIGNLQNGLIIVDDKTDYVQKDFYEKLHDFQLHYGDVLIALSGATTGKIAVVNKDVGLALVNQRVGKFKILSSKEITQEFFYYLAQSDIFKRFVFRNIGQSAQGNLSPNQIKKSEIPLPPLPEQQKIAEVLSTVDDVIQKVDEAIEKTERLKKGLMQELLTKGIGHKEFKDTEIGRIPKEWEVVRVKELITDIKNGFASGRRDESGVVQIRMNNVTTDGRLIFDSYLKVPSPENIDEWLLEKGDFLFNNTNSYDLVGKSTVFTDAPFPCTFSNHFTRMKFKEGLVLPKFILYHFFILWEKGYFKSVAIRHVGQSAVRTDYLLKVRIPLPSLKEQQEIAEILSDVDKKLGLERKRKEKLERIKKGLMDNLLTGKKRINYVA